METRRKVIEIAKARQAQAMKRYRKVREGGSRVQQEEKHWLAVAANEIEMLQKVEEDIQEDIRRQRGQAHRAKMKVMVKILHTIRS
jgi:hypothetical protein